MLRKYLRDYITYEKCTLLGVGVMSKNCVDATIELANEYNIPILMVASRRQIECKEFGGGYVNNWDTKSFVRYVRNKDKNNNVIIERDHGGLWQNNFEIEQKYTLSQAKKSAEWSFHTDVKSGFDIVHIDTSIDIHKNISREESIRRFLYFYDLCHINNDKILVEVGTEEQNTGVQNTFDLEVTLKETTEHCKKNDLPFPSFVVAQTGTKVMETQNIGTFDDNYKEIKDIVDLCNRYEIMLKQHNTDYLFNTSLSNITRLGIHSVNVAPEFGVQETKALIDLLDDHNLKDVTDEFLKISYNSRRWYKWMLSNTTADYEKKAIISGHYVFSDPKFLELKEFAQENIGFDIDNYLKEQVKVAIKRYLFNLKLI